MVILKRSILRILISVLLIISFVATSSVVAFAEETETSANSENNAGLTTIIEDDYSAYLSLYGNSEKASEDVVFDFDKAVLDGNTLDFSVNVAKTGLYSFGMRYKSLDDEISNFFVGVKIDGTYPYVKAGRLEFPRMWCNEDGQVLYDDLGNEFAPQQVCYKDYYYNEAIDETAKYSDVYVVYLTQGKHNISLVSVEGKIEIDYFKFAAIASPENYKAPGKDAKMYDGEPIIIEGEEAIVKSNYFLPSQNDSSATVVSPQSAENRVMNIIGGGNWSYVGDTLVWETPELEEGYYKIGFSFKQSTIIGGKSYRLFKIDGKVPFKEAEQVGFEYDDGWQQKFLQDEEEKPYYVYFSAGKHQISLSVTAGDMGEVRNLLTEAVAELGDLYVDMTKITGETVDIYRDYELFKQIGDMEERLNNSRDMLERAGKRLLEITGQKTGSNYSVINNMILAIDKMLKNKYEAHRHKSYYYTNYCSVSSVLQDLASMPMTLDKIVLCAADQKKAFENPGFFQNIGFSIKRFFISFVRDYNSVSISQEGKESITIWVNWGRDQAQVLTSLLDRSFTPKTGIEVNLKLVNASVIQALLSGKGPDCLLSQARSEPVNLAMRGVLYDLTQFDDYKEVLTRFQPGADVPYWYKDGLYAIPDTQTFFALFYRKDILAEYGIEVPETWEDFDLAAKLLMRNNMKVSMPTTVAVDPTTAGGVGTNNIFPSLLAQNKVPLYKDGGKSTNLLSSEAMIVFEKWTDYYSKMNLDIALDFYNRFRVGTVPLGIASYSLYNTLMVAAPEIKGLWGFTSIPGTRQADGTISHASAGGGSACSILNISENPKAAWEFLKWWTDTDTQLSYSNNVESILGPTGRIALSNVEAIKGLDWEEGSLDSLLSAWSEVEEVPEYPGSYYVARSIYQAFWNVVEANKNTKDMLMKFGKEADDEIIRKWEQYTDRG